MNRQVIHRVIDTSYRWVGKVAIGAFLLGSLAACGGGGESEGDPGNHDTHSPSTPHTAYPFPVPPHFPMPQPSPTNPLTPAKAELGRHLFYDRRMSINQVMSCASCHQPALAFTDGRPTAIGTTGELHPRNSMGLTNVVYNSAFDWANPILKTLHSQALTVLFNEFPVELGWSDREEEILERFRNDKRYQALFAAAYPDQANPFNADNVAKSIATFVSTMVSGRSAYDKAERGDENALNAAAKRGAELFFSERLECFHCHGGFNFSQSVHHAHSAFDEVEFHNNGLYNIGGTGDYPPGNRGLWEFTQQPRDMGRFRAPTLRNIALTAPYMHDGSMATLEEVLDHYARGGRLIEGGPFAGDGAQNPFKSDLITPFQLTAQEKQDLIEFLNSLTDWEFLCDPRFRDPFGHFPSHPHCGNG